MRLALCTLLLVAFCGLGIQGQSVLQPTSPYSFGDKMHGIGWLNTTSGEVWKTDNDAGDVIIVHPSYDATWTANRVIDGVNRLSSISVLNGVIHAAEWLTGCIKPIVSNGAGGWQFGTPTIGLCGTTGNSPTGTATATFASARFGMIRGLTTDETTANMYITDDGNRRVRRADSSGNVVNFIGTGVTGVGDGHRLSATLDQPSGIAFNQDYSFLYVTGSFSIRKLTMATDQVTTITSSLNFPQQIIVMPSGALVIADAVNNRVVRIAPEPGLELSVLATYPHQVNSLSQYCGEEVLTFFFSGGTGMHRVTVTPTEPAPCAILTPAPPSPVPPVCDCAADQLTADYTSDRIPDAAKDAYTTIVLNEATWEVVFTVHNVRHISNGHVIAGKVDTQTTAQTAFTPLISAWDANELWNPQNCTAGAIDTPASNLGITVTKNFNCFKTYEMTFSLVDSNKQNQHCQLVATADDLAIGCNLILSAVRAYDLTEPTAFLSAETSFTANITLPRNLNNNVSDLLYATLAKCNVLNEPDFVLDCRIPGLWTFATTFAVSQSTNWIDASTCVQSQTAVATFVRCGLNNIPVGVYTEVSANITATETNRNEQMRFSIDYTLPRASSATASASLQNFILSIFMLNEKYYYAGADRATILIETFATSRLEITQLDMFNANGQVYSLRAYPQFQLSETSNATHFIIEWRPSAIRQDSEFYRNGPHGVNVSFLFTAASNRRRMIAATDADGVVTVNNIRVAVPQSDSAANDADAASNVAVEAPPTVLIVVIASVAVIAVGSIIAVLTVVRRRRAAHKFPEEATVQGSEPGEDQV